MDTNNKTDPVEALRCEDLFGGFSPRFGDLVENGWASEDNPHRVGIFVETVKDGYRMTDGSGEFWVSHKQNHRLRVLPNIGSQTQPPSTNQL